MRKELWPGRESGDCEICGRTILKGERAEPFLAPGGRRYRVCELCFARAEHQGWIRESAAGDEPTRAGVGRSEQRRSVLARILGQRSRRAPPPAQVNGPEAEPHSAAPADDGAPVEYEASRLRKDPRHVRAVPTTAEVKVERALELFNGSEHRRTIAGLVRTLGTPWVTAVPDRDARSTVTAIVAWELSWYRFRIDLGDEEDPVVLLQKGEELEELEEELRDWNGSIDDEGNLSAGVGSRRPG